MILTPEEAQVVLKTSELVDDVKGLAFLLSFPGGKRAQLMRASGALWVHQVSTGRVTEQVGTETHASVQAFASAYQLTPIAPLSQPSSMK